jgi:NAD(P)H-hydrate epimerase
MLSWMPSLVGQASNVSHFILELTLLAPSSLGFSFHPPVRPPYNRILDQIAQTTIPVLSIDIPSGWDVNDGKQPLVDTEGKPVETFEPEALLSLTAPKLGVKKIRGRHYLGGRFIPQ